MNVLRTCKQLSRFGQNTVGFFTLVMFIIAQISSQKICACTCFNVWCVWGLLSVGYIGLPVLSLCRDSILIESFFLQQIIQQGIIRTLIRLQSTQTETQVRHILAFAHGEIRSTRLYSVDYCYQHYSAYILTRDLALLFFLLFCRTWGRPFIELYQKNKKKWQILGRNMGTDLWGSIPLTRYISHFMSSLRQLHHRSLYDSITTICSKRCKTVKSFLSFVRTIPLNITSLLSGPHHLTSDNR